MRDATGYCSRCHRYGTFCICDDDEVTDIAADLRDAAYTCRSFTFTDLAERLVALADAVEAKDPTAWGMEAAPPPTRTPGVPYIPSWRFTEAHDD